MSKNVNMIIDKKCLLCEGEFTITYFNDTEIPEEVEPVCISCRSRRRSSQCSMLINEILKEK